MNKRRKKQIADIIDAGAMLYDDYVTKGDEAAFQTYCALVNTLSKITGWDKITCARKMIGMNFQISGINVPK